MVTILIVDGQRASREYFASLLISPGHKIIEASDATEALETLSITRPDLIISDVLMHRMDGYEFVEHLRASMKAQTPPVIFCVTKSYEDEARTAALELGVNHVISKAAEPQKVFAAVTAALANHESQPKNGSKPALDRLSAVPPVDPSDPDATVFVVDDDPAMCRLMSNTMRSSKLNVATFSSGEEFLDSYHDQPGCLLTDLQMRGISGIDMLATLRARRMLIPTIIMTARAELSDAQLAMRLEVRDFLEKTVPRRTLLARVYSALQEDLHQRHVRGEAREYRQRLSSLTARERELVHLLIEGRASKEIAAALRISINTVAIHRKHLMAKTGAANVADLVRMSVIANHE